MLSFSLFLGAGAALGLFLVASRAGEKKVHIVLDNAVWAMFGALVVGRAVFVALSWSYYRSHLMEIPAVWMGGLSGPGALAGGVLAVLILIRLGKQKGSLFDDLVPFAGCLTLFSWLGCWYTGDAFGRPVAGWLGFPSLDEWGMVDSRFPVQLIGAVISLLTLYLVDRLQGSFNMTGQKASVWLVSFGLMLTGLSFARADVMPLWAGLRLDTWAGLVFASTGLVVLISTIVIPVMRRGSAARQPAHGEGLER